MYELQKPSEGERVFALGNSGTGKSELLKTLYDSSVEHGIILDTKQDDTRMNDLGRVVKGERIFDVGPGRYVWKVPVQWIDAIDKWDAFFEWALEAGNRVIFSDEIGDVCEDARNYPLWFRRCYQRGRSRFLGMWGTTQELARAPRFAFSACHHRYMFYLGDPIQQTLAKGFFEVDVPWSAIPEPRWQPNDPRGVDPEGYKFVYKGPGVAMQGPFRLEHR